jgi:hypothetical protein
MGAGSIGAVPAKVASLLKNQAFVAPEGQTL